MMSDSTTTTEASSSNKNDNTTTNGPASMVVLRLARSKNGGSGSSRERRRSPTAAADPSSSLCGDGGGRRGILKRPRMSEAPIMTLETEQYVPAPVPAIIENIDDATTAIERDSDLTDEQKDAMARRGRALHQATAAQFYAAEKVELVSHD